MIIFRAIYSIYAIFIIVSIFIGFLITCYISRMFNKNNHQLNYKFAKLFLNIGFFLMQVKVSIKGSHNLPKNNPFILASNHQSLWDIPVLIVKIHNQLSFIAKSELNKIPILGWSIRNCGHYLVDRNKPRKAVKQLSKIEKDLQKDKNIIIFPEGTRSSSQKILKFKRGAFKLAINANSSIIPCYINGSGKFLPKNKLLMKPTKIDIIIGKPILLSQKDKSLSHKEKEELLSEKTRQQILNLQQL
ncbi:hypothetical protein DID75_05190 [Candidatus Marinamargulisbacteria bacterium SCGC AG-410-N11]|nr:hypothetical protein DID75_05190 [Candidatus Marinamargulisbacteria bacterium SCGC AG-410-N11]